MALAVLAGACTPPAPTPVAQAQLDSLPVLDTVAASVVCSGAVTATCPQRGALANWVGRGAFAFWQPGMAVTVYSPERAVGAVLGTTGTGQGQYAAAFGVGRDGDDYIIIDGVRFKLLRFGAAGDFLEESEASALREGAVAGFAGTVPVVQEMIPSDTAPTRMTLTVPPSPGKPGGRVVLDAPIIWLRTKDKKASVAAPLFPATPVFAIDPGRETITSSEGDRWRLETRTFAGRVQWALEGPEGQPVSEEDKGVRRAMIAAQAAGQLSESALDSMVAVTGARHPAITGLMAAPDGTILVAGPAIPTRGAVDYVVVSREGRPTSRFSLPVEVRPLLFARDSILIQRPVGEPLETVWMRLTAR